MKKRPLIPLVISYILGILIGNIYALNLPLLFSYIAIGFLLCFILPRFFPQTRNIGSSLLVQFLILASAQAYITFLHKYEHHFPANHLKNFSFPYPIDLEGRLYALPEKFPKKIRLYLEASRIWSGDLEQSVIGRARINVYDSVDSLELGNKVIVKGVKLYPPKGFRNFNGFDYKAYMERKGIYALGWVKERSKIIVVEQAGGNYLFRGMAHIKAKMLSFIERSSPHPQGAVLRAMILGDKGFLDRGTKQIFREAGIAHLLVVSGLHIGFVAVAFIVLVRPVLRFIRFRVLVDWPYILRPSKLAITLSVFPIIFYALLVGGGIATLRATITALIFLIILLQDRPKDLYSATALAALLLLIWRPYSLFDPGFQLSFVAVLAIAHIVSRISPNYIRIKGEDRLDQLLGKKFDIRTKVFHYILVVLFTSMATYPLTAYYFHQVSLVAPLSNLVIIPLGSLAVPLGLAACGMSLVWEPLAQVLLKLDILILSGIIYLAKLFIGFPGASLRLPTPSLITIFAFYLLLFAGSSYKKTKKVYLWFTVVAGTVLVISLSSHYLSASRDGLLKIVFLDVGEGDAAFIKTPYGKTMMIDSGGIYSDTLDIGEDVIAPFIWNQGFTRIDHMVATHPDRDHIQGFYGLIKNFRVNYFWHNGAPGAYHFPGDFEDLVSRKRMRYSDLRDNYRFLADHGVLIRVFNLREILAKKYGAGKRLSDNNKSLVVKIYYGRVSFLFAADIEKLGEDYLADRAKDLRSTVLKVAHHGSRFSSNKKFLEKVNPEIAVISAGTSNPFGHPAPEVIERLKRLGTKIYRTDQHGSIRITTDGQTYSIQTYTQPQD
jgi:competence protein ComEC